MIFYSIFISKSATLFFIFIIQGLKMLVRSITSYMPNMPASLGLPKVIASSSWKLRGVVTLLALGALFTLVRIFQAPGSKKLPDPPDKPAIKPQVSTPAKLLTLGSRLQTWFEEAKEHVALAPKEQLEAIEGGVLGLNPAVRASLSISEELAADYPHCIKVITLSKPGVDDKSASAKSQLDTAIADIFMIALMCARNPAFKEQTLGLFRACSEGLRMEVNTPGHLGAMTESLPLQDACPDLDSQGPREPGILGGYYPNQVPADIIYGLNNVNQARKDRLGIQEQWRLFFFLLDKVGSADENIEGIKSFLAYKQNFLVKAEPENVEGSASAFYILFKDSGPVVEADEEEQRTDSAALIPRVRALRIAPSALALSPGGTTEVGTPIRGDAREKIAPSTPLRIEQRRVSKNES